MARHFWYKLHPETHVVTPVRNFGGFGQWMKHTDRNVAKTDAYHPIRGKAHVSTVFLGLDHGFDDGDPVLFETMIFGGEHDREMWRYCTWAEAVEGHERAVRLVTRQTALPDPEKARNDT